MTTREKAIVSAWTGFLMCSVAEMLKYMSEKLGWQLSEEELADAKKELEKMENKKMARKSKIKVDKLLTEAQRWYWKDPEKARALQRAKYKQYPEKIYAGNRAWQEKNKEHWNMLMRFAYQIRKAKLAGNVCLESQLRAAREEYKKSRKA